MKNREPRGSFRPRSRRRGCARLLSALALILVPGLGSSFGELFIAVETRSAIAPTEEQEIAEREFSPDSVSRILIELSPAGLQSLRVDGRKDARARVRLGSTVLENVGVHLKGSAGSFRSVEDKPSFTLDFEQFKGGQRWRGLRKIHLNNSVEDASYLKEKLGTELFEAARVPAPRVGYAVVKLNGRSLGLYVLKEGFTKDFVARHFGDGDGNLYDTEQGHDVDLPMKRHLGSGSNVDQDDLHSLAAAAAEPDLDRRWELLRQTLDVDRFLAFIAMEMMICHWDGYGLGKNNFRLYHDETRQKMVFLPTGMDQIFTKSDMPWKPGMSGLVARSFLETSEGQKRYATKFKDLFDSKFCPGRIGSRIRELVSLLRPYVGKGEFEEIREKAESLAVWIADRALNLRKQLGEPELGPLDFRASVARLTGWNRAEAPAGVALRAVRDSDTMSELQIHATTKASASWRSPQRLRVGRYRFEGRAKVADVRPLPFGSHHGACLRVAGRSQRSATLLGRTDWVLLGVEFDVYEPISDVLLICELRAASGQAFFKENSLSLTRLR